MVEYLLDGRRVSLEEYRAAQEQYRYQYYVTPEW